MVFGCTRKWSVTFYLPLCKNTLSCKRIEQCQFYHLSLNFVWCNYKHQLLKQCFCSMLFGGHPSTNGTYTLKFILIRQISLLKAKNQSIKRSTDENLNKSATEPSTETKDAVYWSMVQIMQVKVIKKTH